MHEYNLRLTSSHVLRVITAQAVATEVVRLNRMFAAKGATDSVRCCRALREWLAQLRGAVIIGRLP